MTKCESKTPLVLIVDDDEESHCAISRGLSKFNYEIASVFDGEEALGFIKRRIPDLIVLDQRMPRMNGDIFAEELKRLYPNEEIPVLLCASMLPEHIQQKFQRLGVSMLDKDVVFDKGISNTIGRLLSAARNYTEPLFENAAIGIAICNLRRDFLAVNPFFCKMLGYERDELLRMNVSDITHPEDLQENIDLDRKVIEKKIEHFSLEKRYVRKDGKVFWVLLTVTDYKDEKLDHIFIAQVQDINETKQMQMKLAQQTKMTSLGNFAGGVAHEVNNPLSIVKGQVQYLRRCVEKGLIDHGDFLDRTDKIIRTIGRISGIIGGLNEFSGNTSTEPLKGVSSTRLVQESLQFCQQRYREGKVNLQADFEEDATIVCRQLSISHVLINLLNNARRAAAGSEGKWVKIQTKRRKQLFEISVTDSGSGIPKEIQKNIFEPFFKTTPVGQGTGLGLSVSRGIIESQGGALYLDTDCKNTRFVIELPVTIPTKSAA